MLLLFMNSVLSSLLFMLPAICLERVFRGIHADRATGDILSECGAGRSIVRTEDHRSADHSVLPGELASGMDRLPLLRITKRDRLRARV